MTECRHVWAIATPEPHKALLLGTCKRCAEERSFPAHLPEEWGSLTVNNRAKRHKPKAWKGAL